MSHEQHTEKLVTVINSARVPFILVILMWFVFIIEWVFQLKGVSQWGIYPRHVDGLWGVLFSPFIHGGVDHIINNTPPIFILTWALFYFYRRIAYEVLALSAIFGGTFVWIAARDSFHIGMSGVIYALAFFIFFSGVFRKEPKLLAIALFVVFLYGSMVWGIFPIDLAVSFEGHFFGALTGTALAYFYQREGATFKKKVYQWEIDEENEKIMEKNGFTALKDENGFTVNYEYIAKDVEN